MNYLVSILIPFIIFCSSLCMEDKPCIKIDELAKLNKQDRLAIYAQAIRTCFCGSKFQSHEEIKKHIEQHHTTEKHYYHCSRCSSNHRSLGNLSEHIAFKHTKEPIYTCPDCNLKFSSHKTVMRHNTFHKDHQEILNKLIGLGMSRANAQQKFECTHCFKLFETQIGFFKHVKKVWEDISTLQHYVTRKLDTQSPQLESQHSYSAPLSVVNTIYDKTLNEQGHDGTLITRTIQVEEPPRILLPVHTIVTPSSDSYFFSQKNLNIPHQDHGHGIFQSSPSSFRQQPYLPKEATEHIPSQTTNLIPKILEPARMYSPYFEDSSFHQAPLSYNPVELNPKKRAREELTQRNTPNQEERAAYNRNWPPTINDSIAHKHKAEDEKNKDKQKQKQRRIVYES